MKFDFKATMLRFVCILWFFLKLFTSTNNNMNFQTKLGDLIIANVDFKNDELETLVRDTINKSGAVTASAFELKLALANDENAADVESATGSLIDLAAEIGKTFPKLDAVQADRFKVIVDSVYINKTPAIDDKVQAVFNGAVDVVLSTQALRDYVDAMA